jgi:hypothetical protein
MEFPGLVSNWIKPPSGKFQTIHEVEHLVFDLRLPYDRYEESLELIAKELLRRFRTNV